MNIDDLREVAYRAYSGTSFYPERRRDSVIKDLKEELAEDLKALGENTGNYKEKYIVHARKWLERKGRVMSAMITGPANFPVNRNRKALNAEDSAWDEFRKWRKKYSWAVNQVRNLSPEDDLELAIKKADTLIIRQELMKAANKIIRKKSLTNDQKITEMVDAGFSEPLATKTLEPDVCGSLGFPSYSLTNNNSRIKRAKEKIETLKRRIEAKNTFEPIKFLGGVINIEADRVTITHDEKPSREVIVRIKGRGFNWSPRYQTWSRKHTARALSDAIELTATEAVEA